MLAFIFNCVQALDSGNAFQFLIDDQVVGGIIKSFNCFYVDHVAGDCKVTVQRRGGSLAQQIVGTWPSKDLMLHLVSGETRYVQAETEMVVTEMLIPWTSAPARLIITDPDQAVTDLSKCYYVGPPLPGISKV